MCIKLQNETSFTRWPNVPFSVVVFGYAGYASAAKELKQYDTPTAGYIFSKRQ